MCKKVIYLISFVVVLALAGNASADPDPNLVAYYTLDGDAYDTGNVAPAADGNLFGNPRWTTGRVGLGGSIDLDGNGDFVQIPDADKLDITYSLTVAFWLRVDNFGSNWQMIVIKGTAYNEQVWKFEQDGPSPPAPGSGRILFCVGGEGGLPGCRNGLTRVDDGQWHHVAGVYNGATGEQILYIDGFQDAYGSGTPVTIPTNDLTLNISQVKDGEYVDGGFDELRIYNRALSAEEIADLATTPFLMAHDPDPCTGQVGVTEAAILSWTAGDYASSHDVYFGTDEAAVRDADTSTPGIFKGNQALDANSYDPDIALGLYHYWRIDEVNDACSPYLWPGWVWSFASASYYPTNPSPDANYQYAPLNTNLTWAAGCTATKHRVFFGTASSPPSVGTVYMPVKTWDPPGDLIKGQKYNWKIIALDDINTVYLGPTWSFKATTQLRGWWKFDDGDSNTPDDSSGNNNYAVFGVSPNSMPAWTTEGRVNGALEFDGEEDWVEVTHDPNFDITESQTVTVWIKINDFGGNNQSIIGKYNNWKFERAGTSGTLLWCVEGGAPWTTYGGISIDDAEWHHLAGVYDGATGQQYLYVDGVIDNTTSGTPHVIPTSINPLYIGSNGLACVIDDLRVYDYALSEPEIGALANIPWLYAHSPTPYNGSTEEMKLDKMVTLSWTASSYAASHNVYFGTDFNDVNNANTSTPVIYKGNQLLGDVDYGVGPLETGNAYYWRIDEVNDVCQPYLWKGLTWNFTTADYFRVDNFEDYNNTSPDRIFDPNGWIGGGGGTVGYDEPNYAELSIIHGGRQSMPFDYNSVGDSNATHTFTSSQDWTAEGVKSLELWFRGWPVGVGSWVEASGTHTITASGTDIQGTYDEFHYAYKEVTAATTLLDPDGYPFNGVRIIARVESISPTDPCIPINPWAKAGVMIRQSLDADSTNGMMTASASSGDSFQRRLVAAGTTTNDDVNVSIPYLRLDMDTDYAKLYAYRSSDGSTWTQLGAFQQIPTMTLPVYVGLAVTSHNTAATCTAEFSNVNITAGAAGAWEHQDVGIMSNAAAPLYVTLQDDGSVGGDKATLTHTDPNGVLDPNWEAWDIALNDFKVNNPSLNLEKIKKITLGVGPADPNGTGTLYIDDIRLYKPRCLPEFGPAADFTDDCIVDYADLRILADNWLLLPADPNIDLYEDGAIDFRDYAVLADSWLEEILWP
ncbi:MAG: LamG domain-containing protein [Planctomycetota bacterium]